MEELGAVEEAFKNALRKTCKNLGIVPDPELVEVFGRLGRVLEARKPVGIREITVKSNKTNVAIGAVFCNGKKRVSIVPVWGISERRITLFIEPAYIGPNAREWLQENLKRTEWYQSPKRHWWLFKLTSSAIVNDAVGLILAVLEDLAQRYCSVTL